MYALWFGVDVSVSEKETQILLWISRVTLVLDWLSRAIANNNELNILQGAFCSSKCTRNMTITRSVNRGATHLVTAYRGKFFKMPASLNV